MNIFFSDRCPQQAARNLDDLRLNKMILESCQLMSTAYTQVTGLAGPYKPTHQHHGCTKWVAASREHFIWLSDHTLYMLDEFAYRRGRDNYMHGCYHVWHKLAQPEYYRRIEAHGWTDPPNCTAFKHIDDVVDAYRYCLVHKWYNDERLPRWTNRGKPVWFADYGE